MGNDYNNTDTIWLTLRGHLYLILLYRLYYVPNCHSHNLFLILPPTLLFCTQSICGTSFEGPSHLQIYSWLHQLQKKHLFTASLIEGVFTRWSRKGMILPSDLYVDGTFASFEQFTQYHSQITFL